MKETRDLVLAVNVSVKQLHQADFVVQVKTAMQRQAINPRLLNLELTESMLLGTGCTHYQGYLSGKPVPVEQFEALLKSR